MRALVKANATFLVEGGGFMFCSQNILMLVDTVKKRIDSWSKHKATNKLIRFPKTADFAKVNQIRKDHLVKVCDLLDIDDCIQLMLITNKPEILTIKIRRIHALL